ncbi:MAG: hypothetical protein MJE68_10780 [Proteobacteria bacterium]|nr:hypothetical protein [Pseudomonadota bacterium]
MIGERPLSSAEVLFWHLGQIADSMVEWEGLIADELKLTPADVADIKTKYPQRLKLQS